MSALGHQRTFQLALEKPPKLAGACSVGCHCPEAWTGALLVAATAAFCSEYSFARSAARPSSGNTSCKLSIVSCAESSDTSRHRFPFVPPQAVRRRETAALRFSSASDARSNSPSWKSGSDAKAQASHAAAAGTAQLRDKLKSLSCSAN